VAFYMKMSGPNDRKASFFKKGRTYNPR
jgi:hypothetical protein